MFIILVDIDSTIVDSSVTYEIPTIINYCFDSSIAERAVHITQEIVPKYNQVDFADALLNTPLLVMGCGQGQAFAIYRKGQSTKLTKVFLNNHVLSNQLLGNFTLNNLNVQFTDRILLVSDLMHATGLNITTKLNKYDRPFSFIQFTTGSFGSNLYTADLSRPLTNDLGFYLCGLHWNAAGHRPNAQYDLSSFYTNIYWNRFLPTRFDVVYFSGTSGFPGTNQDTLSGTVTSDFIDASFCTGNEHHKLAAYYNVNNEEYSDQSIALPFTNKIRNYGIDFANYHALLDFEVEYRFAGAVSKIQSKPYGSHTPNSLSLWIRLSKVLNRFVFAGSYLFELSNTEDFFNMPKLTMGVDVFDSTFVCGSVSKHYRQPSIAETHTPDSIFVPYYTLSGNADLRTEYYWAQEISVRRRNSSITMYKYDYDDIIIVYADNDSQYIPQNVGSWQTIGIETSLAQRIYLNQDPDKKTATELTVGYWGNYIFQGDTLPLMPKRHSSIYAAFERRTHKFTFGVSLGEQFIGQRQDFFGNNIETSRLFSALGYVRLLDLHLAFGCNNILDEEYFLAPSYDMPSRNYNFSVKWHFWD
ncbi:MAG: hypothetical protein WBB67_15215 [bacterium]